MEFSSSTKISLNSCSHSGISETSHGFSPFYRGPLFYLFFGIWLAWVFHRFSPFYHQQNSGHWHWRDVTVRCIFPFLEPKISPAVGEEGEDEEDEEEMTLLFS